MNNRVLKLFGAAALAAGLMFAQTTTTTPAPAQGGRQQRILNRATTALGLSTEQQGQLQQIMTSFHQQAQPIEQQLRADHATLMTAAKSGGDVTAAANAIGQDTAKLAVLRAQAFGQFYGMLNAQQKQQVDSFGEHMPMFGGGFGHGRGR